MFLIFPHTDDVRRRAKIHLVDERGRLRLVAPSVEDALRWLYQRGHRRIGTPTGREVEVFLIEPADDPKAERRAYNLRRDHAGKATGEALRRSLGNKRMAEIARSIAYSTDPSGRPR